MSLALAISMASASCYRWRAETIPASSPDFHALGDEVEVTLVDGRVVAMRNAGVVRDSVVGYAMKSPERIAFPVQSVKQVQSWRYSGKRTAGLVVGIGAAFFTVLVVAIIEALGAAVIPM